MSTPDNPWEPPEDPLDALLREVAKPLGNDPSPLVRRALFSRGADLPEEELPALSPDALERLTAQVLGGAIAVVSLSGGEAWERRDVLAALEDQGLLFVPERYDGSQDDDPEWLVVEVGTGVSTGDPVDARLLAEVARKVRDAVAESGTVGAFLAVSPGRVGRFEITGDAVHDALNGVLATVPGQLTLSTEALDRLGALGWSQSVADDAAPVQVTLPLGETLVRWAYGAIEALRDLSLSVTVRRFQRGAVESERGSAPATVAAHDAFEVSLNLPAGLSAYLLLEADGALRALNGGQPIGADAPAGAPVQWTAEVDQMGIRQVPVLLLSGAPLPELPEAIEGANAQRVKGGEPALHHLRAALIEAHPTTTIAFVNAPTEFVRAS